jgi:tetratricopeptide (TPR) repeat protein
LHAQILGVLETLVGDRQDAQVDRLAHHALRGEVWDKAFQYCQQVGLRAFAGSAYRETVAYWEQALEALPHLPADRAIMEQAIDLYRDLAMAMIPSAQWEQRLTYLRAAEPIAEALADDRRLARIYYQIGQTYKQTQEFKPALAYCQRAQAIAAGLGDVNLQAWVNHHMSTIYVDLGDYRQAIACCQQMLTALVGSPYDPFARAVAQLSILARVYMVICLSQVGEFAAGVAYGNEARQIAEAGERPYERVSVDSRVGALYLYQGLPHLAIPLLERAMAMSQEANIPVSYPGAATALARAYAMAGRGPEARAVLVQVRGKVPYPYATFACGEVYLRTGEVKAAYQLAQGALADACHRKMRGWEAWTRWLLGEIAMHGAPPDVASAEAHYQQALILATELGMRPLVAHCRLGLGTLYATTDRREQACTTLATAIGLYRAMEMTFWLPQAEATLAQVACITTQAALT